MANSRSSSSNSFEGENTILNNVFSGFVGTPRKSGLSAELDDMCFDEIEGVEHQKLGDRPLNTHEEDILLGVEREESFVRSGLSKQQSSFKRKPLVSSTKKRLLPTAPWVGKLTKKAKSSKTTTFDREEEYNKFIVYVISHAPPKKRREIENKYKLLQQNKGKNICQPYC
jgi:hypothetical protein